MNRKKVLMVGAGGFAGDWLANFLPAFRDRLVVTGLVDVDRAVLNRAADALGLAPEGRYTDMTTAFAATDADFCILAIPPQYNREAVALAVGRGLPVLSEKPIAPDWKSCVDIYRMVTQTGLKMAVIQNYRYINPIVTLKEALRSGMLGEILYIVARFTVDHRHNGGGKFRHDLPDIMLYEASVHHFDQLRHLSGADCRWITGQAWNVPGSGYDTDCCGLFVMGMDNGVRCQYETAYIAAGTQNDWYREHYRVMGERGSLIVNRHDPVRLVEHIAQGRTRVTDLAPAVTPFESHQAIIDTFLKWLDGGPAPQTVLTDNIKTSAITFAAARASREGAVVDVAQMIAAADGAA
jgi:predicted dehydrogenase